MKATTYILGATAKGLVQFKKRDGEWQMVGVHFKGFNVSMVYVDERTNRWWVGLSHKHWGEKLHYSDDCGLNWHSVQVPSFKGALLPNGKPARLRQLWTMQHGGADRPGTLWLATDPGGLFYSNNNGESFELVESLWNHPSRMKEEQWFGAGSDYPFIHSVVLDPSDSDHLYIAVSCAGVFETTDGGKSWNPRNKGLKAAYLPNPNVEVGHDPHLMLMVASNTRILWQQNHCGIFNTTDGGINWQEVSAQAGIPNYGFALAVDNENPNSAWVIPVESEENRIAPDLALQVYQTEDFGKSWQSVSEGLPQQNVFDIALRQAFAKQGDLMVFGTTNGNLYLSEGKNIKWINLTSNLTKFNSVVIS